MTQDSGLKAQDSGLKTQDSNLGLESWVLGHCNGFSLVEIVIALSILGIGLIGSMRVFPVGLRASQRAQLRSRAAFIAQQTLEPLKTAAWDQLIEGQARKEQKPFTVVTAIRLAQPEHVSGSSALKQVEVSVEWLQEGKLRTETFATYLRRQPS